jgi:predicted nucleic acid-binding protein
VIKDKPIFVLDSFALLAFLENETGGQQVQDLFGLAKKSTIFLSLSIINLGEVLYITERERGLPVAQKVLALIEELPIIIVDATRELVFAAAHIKARNTISYADSFAAALTIQQKATLVTGDQEFKTLEKEFMIEWL